MSVAFRAVVTKDRRRSGVRNGILFRHSSWRCDDREILPLMALVERDRSLLWQSRKWNGCCWTAPGGRPLLVVP